MTMFRGGGQATDPLQKDTRMQRGTKYALIGFTLAEVLITLGVIGIVAAMTLPALVQNYQKWS